MQRCTNILFRCSHWLNYPFFKKTKQNIMTNYIMNNWTVCPQVDRCKTADNIFWCFTKSQWECDAFSTVRPPALNWNVSKTEYKFYINWNYPEITADWKIRINYTECKDLKVTATKGQCLSLDFFEYLFVKGVRISLFSTDILNFLTFFVCLV